VSAFAGATLSVELYTGTLPSLPIHVEYRGWNNGACHISMQVSYSSDLVSQRSLSHHRTCGAARKAERFTESSSDRFALDFPLSRAGNGSALCTTPTGFTHFVCTAVPLSEAFGLLCSFLELLFVLILSMFSPSRLLGTTPAPTAGAVWSRLTPVVSI
jgi:hypothetical protein